MDARRSGVALNPERIALSKRAAHALKHCLDNNIRPLDLITEQSLTNAFVLDMAMGGSTNTILHTLALAHSAGIQFPLERLNEISARTPNICKVSPSRPEVHIEDVHRVGGMAAILKEVARDPRSLLKLDVPTIHGSLRAMVEARARRRWRRDSSGGEAFLHDRRAGRAVRQPGAARSGGEGGGRDAGDDGVRRAGEDLRVAGGRADAASWPARSRTATWW